MLQLQAYEMWNLRFWVVFLLALITNGVPSVTSAETMRLEMVHRHDPRAAGRMFDEIPQRTKQLERIKDLIWNDSIREGVIRRRAWETARGRGRGSGSRRGRGRKERDDDGSASGVATMNSAADFGTGMYFVTLKVGSPAQRVTLIADTGSDLLWMNCDYRCSDGGSPECAAKKGPELSSLRRQRAFDADASGSFKTIPCRSQMCTVELSNMFSLVRCPTPVTPCAYDYRYNDGSQALGIFANETISLKLSNGRKRRIHDMLVGCTQSIRGEGFVAADGVLGLGFSKYSFAPGVAASFRGKFSYCLVDHWSPHNVTNYLTFGRAADLPARGSNMRYTDLVLGTLSPFYAVNMRGISIGNVMLNIPPQIWDASSGGGTILDSGTSLTNLAQPAYEPVRDALLTYLKKFRRVELEEAQILDHCFNATGFNESQTPRLAFHFVGGARFQPLVKSYIIDAAEGVKCLGIISTGSAGVSLIGNIMQQNFVWEFDLVRSKLGFAPSECI